LPCADYWRAAVAAVVIMPNTNLVLARVLLDGYIETNKVGLPEHRYLDKKAEREGRKALAFILRQGAHLDRDLRYMLAALFDPENAQKKEMAITGRTRQPSAN
jgi:hypothetical protein